MNEKAQELEHRLIMFSVAVIKFYDKLPRKAAAQHLGNQLLRSGTSPTLNYGEACMAESKKDFIHKMKICLKELKESGNCLKIIFHAQLFNPGQPIDTLLNECTELIAIFVKSLKTVQNNC